MVDTARIRGMFKLPADEEFLGAALWGESSPSVACQCDRRGGAKMWFFRSCMGFEFELNAPPEVYHFTEVHLEPSLKAVIQHNSFSVPLRCYSELRIVPVDTTRPRATIMFMDEQLGSEASKAIQFVWQYSNNELSERSHVHLACNRFADVLSVNCRLPVREVCTLISAAGKVQGKLELCTDGRLQFSRGFTEHTQASDYEWLLDDIIMVRTGKGLTELSKTLEIVHLASPNESKTVIFGGFRRPADLALFEDALTKAWCLNCNSDINYLAQRNREDRVEEEFCPSPHRKKRNSRVVSFVKEMPDTRCFSVKDVESLLKTFISMDEDGSGTLCEREWTTSLGPVFRDSHIAKAVFSVFDGDRDRSISFSEFLFGCRILQLGSQEDRLLYQYRIFDPEGVGYITVQRFIEIAKVLDEAAGLPFPNGQSLPEYCTSLFRQMNATANGVVISEFRDFIQTDPIFSGALERLAAARDKAFEQGKAKGKSGKPVWFGDPQWLQCTAILLGLKLCEDYRVELEKTCGPVPGRAEEFKAAFDEKAVWELGTQKRLTDPKAAIRKKPAPNVDATKTSRKRQPLVLYESYFIDYSPKVFFALQKRFGIDPEEYKESLGIDQLQSSMLVGSLSNLSSVASSGRSGAFFFASHDGNFILKTIDKGEGKILRRFLPAYYDHIMSNPGTLLTRYFGLHALCYGGEKMYFLVMNNVTKQDRFRIQQSYDLKGSTINRTTPVDRRKNDVALKDLDFKRKLDVEPDVRRMFMNQVRADTDLLRKARLNDYSLLLGIHTSADEIGAPPLRLVKQEPFYRRFHGGIPSKDRREIYFVGIIDLLTEFGIRKKGEYTVKTVWYRGQGKVSCVPPEQYRERFIQYLDSIFPPPYEPKHPGSPQASEPPNFPARIKTQSTFNFASANLDILSPTGSPRGSF